MHWTDPFSERLAAIADFPDTAKADQNEPAIELISDHEAIETELTRMPTSYINMVSYNHYI